MRHLASRKADGLDDREKWLAETMVSLADMAFAGFEPVAYSRQLTELFAQLLAPAEVGLFVLDERAGPQVAAATSDQMHELSEFELRQEDGPRLESLRDGGQILNQDLEEAGTRWPKFAAQATATGFRTVHALPLRHRATMVGAIGVLDERAHQLAEPDAVIARTLANAAAIGFLQHRTIRHHTERAEQLQHALTSRVVIEQAKGVVATRLELEVDAAFTLLRDYARRNNRRLAEVATEVVARRLPMADLMATGGKNRRRV
jgi:hypothetical protein